MGGTGKEGRGLALRWMAAGYQVIIGSRQPQKAASAAALLNEQLGAKLARGLSNAEAARQSDIAVLTVPYHAHQATLSALRDELQGKILVDVTVPLKPPQVTRVHLPQGGSAAVQAQQILGAGARVVSAFQNVSEHALRDLQQPLDCDVLVCGDDAQAKADVIELARALDANVRAFDAGPLANSVVAEALTPVIIGLGKQFRRLRVGIRVTGVGE
ncbi:MAG: NADPH-dependent F420 reductase [Delftia sp.]|nr:NADPH-dependent F420 reductase [Delftia sp.]